MKTITFILKIHYNASNSHMVIYIIRKTALYISVQGSFCTLACLKAIINVRNKNIRHLIPHSTFEASRSKVNETDQRNHSWCHSLPLAPSNFVIFRAIINNRNPKLLANISAEIVKKTASSLFHLSKNS